MGKDNDIVSMQYADQLSIDFRNIKSAKEQAKLEIMLLDISTCGASLFVYDVDAKINNLRRQKNGMYNPEIDKLNQQSTHFVKICSQNRKKKSEIIKEFWYEKWRAVDDFASSEYNGESEETSDDEFEETSDFESIEKSDNKLEESHQDSDEIINIGGLKIKMSSLLDCDFGMEEPVKYSPPNDPVDEFGWNSFCNKKARLLYDHQKELEMCKLSEKNKSLETSIKIIDDKKRNPSISDDSEPKTCLTMLSCFVIINKKYQVMLHREWLKFCQSKDFMSEELKESFKDDEGIKYLMERPTPGL